jgi:nicotinamide riboside transporter PnuC
MKTTDKYFVAGALALTTAMLWFAIFHASGHARVMMLIYVFLMAMTIPLKFLQSKKRKEGKKIESAVFRRGVNKRPVVIGAVLGALLWLLAFRFLPHSH